MPHPGHQVSCADLRLRCPDVPGVPQVVEVHALHPELLDRGRPPHALGEVGPPDRAALVAGEKQCRRSLPDAVAQVLKEVGTDGFWDYNRAQPGLRLRWPDDDASTRYLGV